MLLNKPVYFYQAVFYQSCDEFFCLFSQTVELWSQAFLYFDLSNVNSHVVYALYLHSVM